MELVKPIILVEGPDGAGKTTLARELAVALKVPYYHSGPPETKDPLTEYWQYTKRLLVDGGVVDRFYLGELVYGPLRRQASYPDRFPWLLLELFLFKLGALQVILTGDVATLRSRKQEQSVEQLLEEKRAYDKVWHWSKMRNIVFTADYFQHRQRQLVEAVLKEYEAVPRCPVWLAHTDGIGQISRPAAMLLAHERNGLSGPNVVLNSPAGRYLFEAIAIAGVDPRALFIVNVLQSSGRDELRTAVGLRTWDAVEPLLVVALGEQAAKLSSGSVHAVVPHPQWCRRFRHNDTKRYGEVLKQAIEIGQSCSVKEF